MSTIYNIHHILSTIYCCILSQEPSLKYIYVWGGEDAVRRLTPVSWTGWARLQELNGPKHLASGGPLLTNRRLQFWLASWWRFILSQTVKPIKYQRHYQIIYPNFTQIDYHYFNLHFTKYITIQLFLYQTYHFKINLCCQRKIATQTHALYTKSQ